MLISETNTVLNIYPGKYLFKHLCTDFSKFSSADLKLVYIFISCSKRCTLRWLKVLTAKYFEY